MAGEDPEYIARVKRLPCCAGWCGRKGPSDAHHHRHRGAGIGQKAHDHDSMPLCRNDHDCFHKHIGPFKEMSKLELKEWQDQMVYLTQSKLMGLEFAEQKLSEEPGEEPW